MAIGTYLIYSAAELAHTCVIDSPHCAPAFCCSIASIDVIGKRPCSFVHAKVWPQAVMGWIGKGCPLPRRPPHQPLQLRTRARRTRSWCHKGRAVSWSQGRIGGPLTPITWLFQMSRWYCHTHPAVQSWRNRHLVNGHVPTMTAGLHVGHYQSMCLA